MNAFTQFRKDKVYSLISGLKRVWLGGGYPAFLLSFVFVKSLSILMKEELALSTFFVFFVPEL